MMASLAIKAPLRVRAGFRLDDGLGRDRKARATRRRAVFGDDVAHRANPGKRDDLLDGPSRRVGRGRASVSPSHEASRARTSHLRDAKRPTLGVLDELGGRADRRGKPDSAHAPARRYPFERPPSFSNPCRQRQLAARRPPFRITVLVGGALRFALSLSVSSPGQRAAACAPTARRTLCRCLSSPAGTRFLYLSRPCLSGVGGWVQIFSPHRTAGFTRSSRDSRHRNQIISRMN